MGAESGMNSSVRDDRVALSDGAKALWGKTNRIDDSEWLPLYVHMVDSAAMASKIWDTWVPQGTKAVIVGDLGNDEVLARKLMIFMAGIHDIGKATPVFQAKSITFGPEAGSFAWKAERAGLPMIAGLRGTNHPTHPIAGEIILEGYLLRVRGWERKAARQYACVVGGHHGTPPDKSKIDEEKNRKTNVGLDSEAWVSTQDELIDFVANIAGIEEKEWEDLSERRFSVQSAVLMTGLVIMADWIASNSDEDMFPLVRTEPWADEDEDFFFSESGEEDDIQSWSGLRIRADRAWSCVQLPHAWVPEGIPSSCQDLFATRFTLPEGAKVRPVQEEAVRIARDTRQPGLMVIEAPMGEGKTEAALAAAEILAQRTGRGGVCVALPTMATTDAMFTRVRRWLEALPSCDFDNEKTVWLAHGKAQLNNDFRGIIAASHRRFSSVDQDDVKQESSQNRKKKQIDVPPETVVSDWLWGRKKGALANFLVCTVDQVLMSALQMKHVVLRQLAMANKVVIIDECHAYDAYMQEYLKMALEWLGGYRTPVILLSATLPECQRNAMVEAYLKGWCDTEPRKASKVSILEQLRARNASNTHHINHTANSEMSCEKGTAEKLRLISNAYPLLTYTDGHETKHADVKPSGRSMKVQCRLVDDDDTALLDLMDALLVDGGCIGVICDTVGRAQHAAELLGNHCGRDCVRLTHSRFMDIDRMSNERELRDLLQLAGPLQSWGDSSRFVRRETRNEPTKSGVIGMLASAQGRNREDSIEDLLGLSFGVRIEQRGRIIRDLQTEKSMTRKRNSNRFDKEMPLTYRYYLSDARFLVALGAKRELLETLDQAIHTPKWPLFLGRRSCPPDYPLSLGIHDEYADVRQALDSEPWHAAKWYRRRYRQPDLEIVCDAMEGEDTSVQSDLPLSFSSTGRKYADRVVYRYRIPNPDASENVGDNTEKPPSFDSTGEADPMSFI